MAMRHRRGIGAGSEQMTLNLTPLLDVVLQLITFFMMLIHFGTRLEGATRAVKLPVAPAALPGADLALDRITVVIDDRGRLVTGSSDGIGLESARQLKRLERFVDFSTSEVFGSNAFRAEESGLASIGAVGEARWIYAVSKLTGEHMAHAYHREFGLPAVTLRPFNPSLRH